MLIHSTPAGWDERAWLFPTHDHASLLYLRRLFGMDPENQPCFYRQYWYVNEVFAQEALSTRWCLLRTRFEPNSTSKTWTAQQELVTKTHSRSRALDVILAFLLVYQTQEHRRLLEGAYAWCVEEAPGGDRVDVGGFGSDGMFVDGFHPSATWDDHGVVLSRNAS